MSDSGVTKLYLRLKCRATDRLLVGLPGYLKYRTVGHADPATLLHGGSALSWSLENQPGAQKEPHFEGDKKHLRDRSASPVPGQQQPSVPHPGGAAMGSPREEQSMQTNLSEGALFSGSLRPHQLPYERALLFDDKGLEMFNAAQAHGSSSEIARVYISLDEEPSKKLKVARNVLRHAPMGRR